MSSWLCLVALCLACRTCLLTFLASLLGPLLYRLPENFSISNLSTVMLACKSEIFPKAVDPYYASDMAAVYNVGLAECTVESEEGKKRMRDCFSYLVKEVAKSRNGRQKRGNSAQQSPSASPAGAASASSSQGPDDDASTRSLKSISSQGSLASSTRDRNNSGASSTTDSIPVTQGERGTFLNGLPGEPFSPSSAHPQSSHGGAHGQGRSMRKLSDATTTSEVPSLTGSNSEDEAALQHVMTQAKLGLQSAKAAGGYVSIDELWDKLFFAGVSGNGELLGRALQGLARGYLLIQLCFLPV